MQLNRKRLILTLFLLVASAIASGALYTMIAGRPGERALNEIYPLVEQGRFEEAAEKLRVVLRDDPTRYEAHCYLATCLHKLGDYEGAAEHYGIAKKLKPNDAFAYIGTAKLYMDEGDLKSYISEMKAAVGVEPDSALAHAALARALAHLGDLRTAQKHFRLALDIAPNDPPSTADQNAYHELAQVYMREGEYAKAEDVLNTCLKMTGKDAAGAANQATPRGGKHDATTFLIFGLICMNQSRFEEAITYFKKALSIYPNLAQAHYKLGVAYLQLGRKGKALRELERAVRLAPNKPETHHTLGKLLLRLGDEARGKRHLRMFESIKSKLDKRERKARRAAQRQHQRSVVTTDEGPVAPPLAPLPASSSSHILGVGESEIEFTDVTRSANIRVKHFNGVTPKRYLVETFCGGGGFLDFDNDGDLDIYVVNGAPLQSMENDKGNQTPRNILLRGGDDGTFTDATEIARVGDANYGLGCSFGDYDNDGDVDIHVTNFGENVLFRNNGDGTFTDVTKLAGVGDARLGTSSTFLDYDRDGFLDLFVANYVDFKLEKNIECRINNMPVYCHPKEYDSQPDILYRNNGDGTFSDVTDEANINDPSGRGLGVVITDFDNDGDSDIFVANDITANNLHRNNGDGTFTDIALISGVAYNPEGLAQACMGVDAGDYNNDGLMDLIATNFENEANALYCNDGNGMFTDVSSVAGIGPESFFHLGFGTGFFDYDNDGWQDIFIANGHMMDNIAILTPGQEYAQKDMVMRNNRDGKFLNVTDSLGKAMQVKKVGRAACFGDYDDDGDLDIFIVNLNQRCRLLRNDGGNRNNWLMVRCIGVSSNRNAIGARIKIRYGDFAQVREVKGGSSYLSQNDPRVHFGLGKSDKVDVIEIKWPSGKTQELRDVGANQLLLIVER